MGCGGLKDTAKPNRKAKKKKRSAKKGSGVPMDKINMDKFLSANLYCPTTELEEDDCVACGTKDDDIAYLIRDINPDAVNYYHFECVETTHSDFSVGIAQVNPVSNVIFQGNSEDEQEPEEEE